MVRTQAKLGLGSFTPMVRVRSLVRELRPCKLCHIVKERKKKRNLRFLMVHSVAKNKMIKKKKTEDIKACSISCFQGFHLTCQPTLPFQTTARGEA